jgi:hypothetical protein
MTKLFYVSGDSFSFGQELSGPRTQEIFYHFDDFQRRKCYSGLITDKLGIPNYINNSLPGGSNQRVYRNLLIDIPKALDTYSPDEIFVNISITNSNRREFFMNITNIWTPHMYNFAPKKHFRQMYNFWETLVKETSNDTESYTFDMMLILAMQNFLVLNKIPYLFTTSMMHNDEVDIYKSMFPIQTFNQLKLNRIIFKSFHTFVAEGNYPRGPQIHPLEEGHAAWADYVLDYIQTNDLFNNKDLK